MQIKIITSEQHQNLLKLCNKGKHQFRENNFGVIFCIRCGLLSHLQIMYKIRTYLYYQIKWDC